MEPERTKKIIQYVFLSFISFIGKVGVDYTRKISEQLESLNKMVAESNTRLEVMTTSFMDQKEITHQTLRSHEHRLRRIEMSSVK